MRNVAIAVVAFVIAFARVAAAQPKSPPPKPPPVCPECVRGDALIDKLSLQPIRAMAADLATSSLSDPLTQPEYARIVELRRTTPAIVRLGAADDTDLVAIAAALCHSTDPGCTGPTVRTLRCFADRCDVALPEPPVLTQRCEKREPKKSPRLGFGVDWANGWQRSRYPADGHVWSIGLEGRLRITHRVGAVVRIDRTDGSDGGTDDDNNGYDDVESGSITRIGMLAGASFVLDETPWEGDQKRIVRLDLLGGYASTRTQLDEGGPIAGVDLGFQLAFMKIGVRVVQGFAGASDATMALVHYGFVVGNELDDRGGCLDDNEEHERSSPLGVGFSIPVGVGFARDLGFVSGFGWDLMWHLSPRFDATARADVLAYPGYERDRTLHAAVLGGLRFDHGRSGDDENDDDDSRTGWMSSVMFGYTHAGGLSPSTSGSGPIIDVATGFGYQADAGGAFLRLHGRFGLSSENIDYRALFLTMGMELRIDEKRWRDRI